MNQRPQQRPTTTPAARPATTTPPDVARLAEELTSVMSELLVVVEQETELVRAGKVREGMRLEAQKSELSRRYMMAVEHLKSMQKMLSQTEPELLATLRRHHETFRAMLQVNLTVLATAHAVSEGIVRGVNAEVQRRNIPNTYTAAGRRAVPGPRNMTPIAVSRSL
ncbi:hypothetical protein [Bradyrhizobium sp. ORS 111]|uniref:hypothetical protein n=1 Tax=Bradyrhizobium sp. ORS 111 TaxID=1685958 RepID=UPI00388F789B